MIAGVDEAGRGCLAGPVVAAAVMFSPDVDPLLFKDSKTLTASKRDDLFDYLYHSKSDIGLGVHSASFIDRVNILNATLSAMAFSVQNLTGFPTNVLVDGNKSPKIEKKGVVVESIVKGDQKIPEISAASIVAKVTRDRIMDKLAEKYPLYDFDIHKGYATSSHYESIFENGILPKIHRSSFNLTRQTRLF